MKIKVEEFLNLLHKKEDEIIDGAVYSKLEFLKDFKEELFEEIHNQSSIENYISDVAYSFSSKNLGVEEVFKERHTFFYNYINEVLSEKNEVISDVKSMDSIYREAGFRYLLAAGDTISAELLGVYCLRDVYRNLSDLNAELELDTSNYEEFTDADDLVENFANEIVRASLSSNDIINIEDYSKELCNDYFDLSL